MIIEGGKYFNLDMYFCDQKMRKYRRSIKL